MPPDQRSLTVPPPGGQAPAPAVRRPGSSVSEVLHHRRHRASGWTPIRVAAFIEKLGETGSVTRAAAYVRLSTVAAYALRNHPDGALFAAAWDDAVGARHEMLADLALDRVRDGVERNRWYKGQLVGVDRVFSDRLLTFLLDRTDPQRRATGGGRAAAGDTDDVAIDRLLGGPDVDGTGAVPAGVLAAAPGTGADGAADGVADDDDHNPADAIAAALAAELAAETALSPEDEAMTAASIARREARIAAGKAEQAAFDAKVDAWLHPDRAAK